MMTLDGYGLYLIFTAWWILFRQKKNYPLFKKWDSSVRLSATVLGIICIGWSFYFAFTHIYDDGQSYFARRAMGAYWFYFWSQIAAVAVLTQVIWIDRIRNSPWLRMIVGILSFFSLNGITTLMITYHRDYEVTPVWERMLSLIHWKEWMIALVLFIGLTAIVRLLLLGWQYIAKLIR